MRTDTSVTFIFLLRCWCLCSLPRGQRFVSLSVVFSGGTLLLVEEADERDGDHLHLHLHRHPSKTTDSGPTIQILSSIRPSQDPGSPRMLLCLLSELTSPLQDVLWWVDDTLVTSSDAALRWMRSELGGSYSVTSAWEVPAADWRSGSTYWCGTIQQGRVFRRRVCSRD